MNNPILNLLLVLVPLVVIHELGHFIMAKLGGIRVTNFSFGFGKKLFGFWYKGTEYRWNLLPLGGYVNFMGDLTYDNEIPEDVMHFYNRPKWIRFLVLVMGPLFNILLAFGLLWFYRSSVPVAMPVFKDPLYTVGHILEDSSVDLAGLQLGDRITALDGKEVKSADQLFNYFSLNPNYEVTLSIVRHDKPLEVKVKIPEHPIEGYGVMDFGPSQRLVVGGVQEGMPASEAGLRADDLVVRLNGQIMCALPNGFFGEKIQEAARGQVLAAFYDEEKNWRTVDFTPAGPTDDNYGLTLESVEKGARVVSVAPGSPAENAGVKPGEYLYELNGAVLEDPAGLNERARAFLDGLMVLEVARGEETIFIEVKARQDGDNYLLGLSYYGESELRELNVKQAFSYALGDVSRGSTLIFTAVFKLVSGRLPVKTMSSVVDMGRIANQAAQAGFWVFIYFMAMISLNLGILNLLPIPVLDGGEIFVLLVEWISRKDFSLVAKMKIKMVGFFFLVGLMGVVIVNDVIKLISSWG